VGNQPKSNPEISGAKILEIVEEWNVGIMEKWNDDEK
jgi:hypothetical protein